jgi:hypothetical protein
VISFVARHIAQFSFVDQSNSNHMGFSLYLDRRRVEDFHPPWPTLTVKYSRSPQAFVIAHIRPTPSVPLSRRSKSSQHQSHYMYLHAARSTSSLQIKNLYYLKNTKVFRIPSASVPFVVSSHLPD